MMKTNPSFPTPTPPSSVVSTTPPSVLRPLPSSPAPSSVLRPPSSVVCHPSSVLRPLPSSPAPSSVLRPPSSVVCHPSSALRPQPSALRPLVSICLPTLNARRFLEPRIESIFAQKLTDWELIVCDSFSDDGTWEYLQPFKDDPRVRLYQVPKEGLYAGWNECLRRCRGEYVYIATADDTCEARLLEKMVGALEAAKTEDGRLKTEDRGDELDVRREKYDVPRSTSLVPPPASHVSRSTFHAPQLPADIAVCNFDYIDENGEIIDPPLPPAGAFYGDERYRAHRRSGYVEFLVHLLIGTSWTTMTAVVFRRSLLEKTGLFVTDAGPLADRFWAYKSALYSDTIVVPETLATWRQHAEQGTSASRKRSMRALRRLWRKTEAVVGECVPLMPAAWKQEPGFLDTLLWAERRHYYDLYCLSRTNLRTHFAAFAAGLVKAAVLEPRYLARRLLSGLAWEPDAGVGEVEYLRRLMRAGNVGEF